MDSEFTVVEHLAELRNRVVISLLILIAASLLAMPFSSTLLKILKLPAAGVIDRLVYFSPEEAFVIYMRISFLAGFIISLPFILYQLWTFISPAVDSRFKSSVIYFISLSSLVFLLGSLFAYFLIIPNALRFLLTLGAEDLEPMISATKYIAFVTGLIFACGIVFEMPVLSFFLTRFGIIDDGVLKKNFKYALVAIFVIAAIITPTGDAFNMMMLAIPMVLLYWISVLVSMIAVRKNGDTIYEKG